MFSSSSTDGIESGWSWPRLKAMPAAEPFEVLVPVEEGHLELPPAFFLTVEADAFEAEEHGIHRSTGRREDLRFGLEDLELLVREGGSASASGIHFTPSNLAMSCPS